MTDSYAGQSSQTARNGDVNQTETHIRNVLGRISTTKLVKIIAVHGGGPNAMAGTVDVQQMTNQVDGLGNMTAHGTTYGLIYFRHQTGNSAIIMDPAVGDMGHASICDRDISANVTAMGQANPGSNRRFDMADGIYHGGVLNAAPTQMIAFTAAGITWKDVSGNMIVTTSSGTTITDAFGNVITMESGDISVAPKSGNKLYLGGKPGSGTFSPVMTVAGPSSIAQAKL